MVAGQQGSQHPGAASPHVCAGPLQACPQVPGCRPALSTEAPKAGAGAMALKRCWGIAQCTAEAGAQRG